MVCNQRGDIAQSLREHDSTAIDPLAQLNAVSNVPWPNEQDAEPSGMRHKILDVPGVVVDEHVRAVETLLGFGGIDYSVESKTVGSEPALREPARRRRAGSDKDDAMLKPSVSTLGGRRAPAARAPRDRIAVPHRLPERDHVRRDAVGARTTRGAPALPVARMRR